MDNPHIKVAGPAYGALAGEDFNFFKKKKIVPKPTHNFSLICASKKAV